MNKPHTPHSDATLIELIEKLWVEQGIGLSRIAKLADVSVSALRRFRSGLTDPRKSVQGMKARDRLGRFDYLLTMLAQADIEDPASWLETPLALPAGYTIRPLDLYEDSSERFTDLRLIAQGECTAEEVLSRILPDWRQEWYSPDEVIDGPDGCKSIVPRSRNL